jgi:hypothetical protein
MKEEEVEEDVYCIICGEITDGDDYCSIRCARQDDEVVKHVVKNTISDRTKDRNMSKSKKHWIRRGNYVVTHEQ